MVYIAIVKKLKEREIQIMSIASKAGGISYKFANDKFGISMRRLNNLVQTGYLEKHIIYQVENEKIKNRYVYDLGDKGKCYVKEAGICSITQGFNGYKHLLKTEEVVYRLVKEEYINIKEILNEKEQIEKFEDRISYAKSRGIDFRVNDLAVVSNNEVRSIEIDTGYSNKLKTQHRNYAELILNVVYESIS